MNLVAQTRLHHPPFPPANLILSLTATERTQSRHWWTTTTGERVFLQLPRGTVLRDGDLLQAWPETQPAAPPTMPLIILIQAQAEPVLTIRAATPLELLQAAYHLGNRHVPVEIQADYLRISPDPVLEKLLQQRGLTVQLEQHPFEPEPGAYSHDHGISAKA